MMEHNVVVSDNRSEIRPHGYYSREHCGYCKKGNSTAYGATSSKMLSEDYESLMLIGWRRSGTFLYKPTMHKTCCPQYAIRLNVKNFKPSKQQKQVLKKVERYLSTGTIKSSRPIDSSAPSGNTQTGAHAPFPIVDNITPTTTTSTDTSAVLSRNEITIKTVPPEATEERFELYKKYQIIVHQDDPEEVTMEKFIGFLIQSPLVSSTNINNNNNNQPLSALTTDSTSTSTLNSNIDSKLSYGSYHQLYRLNTILIAVGVIDILPTGISSVYCFYNPDYKDLVLGKYTALQEIKFCLDNNLEYYYMGFYIHSCIKMRYKGEYRPSELLCPTSFTWRLLDECIPILSIFKFSPLEVELAKKRAHIPIGYVSIQNDTMDLEVEDSTLPQKNEQIIQTNITDTTSTSTPSSSSTDHSSTATSNGDDSANSNGDVHTHNSNNNTENKEDISEDVKNDSEETTAAEETALIEEKKEEEDNGEWKLLEEFSPNINKSITTQELNGIALDVGAGIDISLKQLTDKGKEIVKPILEAWTEVCPTNLLSKILVKFV